TGWVTPATRYARASVAVSTVTRAPTAMSPPPTTISSSPGRWAAARQRVPAEPRHRPGVSHPGLTTGDLGVERPVHDHLAGRRHPVDQVDRDPSRLRQRPHTRIVVGRVPVWIGRVY